MDVDVPFSELPQATKDQHTDAMSQAPRGPGANGLPRAVHRHRRKRSEVVGSGDHMGGTGSESGSER